MLLALSAWASLVRWPLDFTYESTLRDYFWMRLQDVFGDNVVLNGHPSERLPNTLNVSFRGFVGGDILAKLPNVAASTGSACHAGTIGLSPVLRAMGVPEEIALGAIRFSLGRTSTAAEVDCVVEQLRSIIGSCRSDLLSSKCGRTSRSETDARRSLVISIGQAYIRSTFPSVLRKWRSVQDVPQSSRRDIYCRSLSHIPALKTQTFWSAVPPPMMRRSTRLSDELALVVTTDFFTPIVDVPYDFGAIAAANALSDVYAMGAEPLLALNLVGFPDDKLPVGVLADILRGAADKAAEAGIAIVGGHTIKSEEPTFGLCVVGTVHPEKVLTNSGAARRHVGTHQADRPGSDHHCCEE